MYYRGNGGLSAPGGLRPQQRRRGLGALGIEESERLRRNAVAETLARKWDNDALNYLRARSRYIPSFEVPVGAPYEPEGGVVTGWATASARTDAANRHQAVVSFLAWSAPPPPNVPTTTTPTVPATTPTTTTPTTGGGTYAPGEGQPLPEVTVLGKPDAPPLALLALAGVAAFLLLSPRSRGA